MPIHISIVEDDVRLRGTLGRLFDSHEGFCCPNQHSSVENALAELPLTQPDVVIMDINLPGMNGVDCVRRLKEFLPETRSCMPGPARRR